MEQKQDEKHENDPMETTIAVSNPYNGAFINDVRQRGGGGWAFHDNRA